jgi:hypothetical protein
MNLRHEIIKTRSRRGDPGRTLFATLVIGATVAGLILVALSPLALRSLAALHGFRWGNLAMSDKPTVLSRLCWWS